MLQWYSSQIHLITALSSELNGSGILLFIQRLHTQTKLEHSDIISKPGTGGTVAEFHPFYVLHSHQNFANADHFLRSSILLFANRACVYYWSWFQVETAQS